MTPDVIDDLALLAFLQSQLDDPALRLPVLNRDSLTEEQLIRFNELSSQRREVSLRIYVPQLEAACGALIAAQARVQQIVDKDPFLLKRERDLIMSQLKGNNNAG